MKKLVREETQNLLQAVEDSFPHDQCSTCECFLAYLVQLSIDSRLADRDLFLPFKVDQKDVHKCLDCDPCPPGDLHADYMQKKQGSRTPSSRKLSSKKENDMLSRRNMFDHRKEARRKLIAFVPVYGLELNVLLGYLVDLTVHGAKVEGERPARVNQRITLGIEFPEDVPEALPSPFTIPARVVRCKQEEGSQYYNIGFEFTKVASKQAKIIQAVIQRYAFRPVADD